MPKIVAVRSGARIFALILIILILLLGGVVWFDYLGLINVKEMISPVVTPVASRLGIDFGLPEQIENVEDINLLEKERLNKRQESLGMREAELDIRETEIESKEAEIAQMLDSLSEREAAFEEQEKSFNDRLKAYDNRNTNLRQAAEYFVGMPPDAAVGMFLEMDDQDVIDIMRAHQKISDEEGSASMVFILAVTYAVRKVRDSKPENVKEAGELIIYWRVELNSAPVQLLPIDHGNEYKNKVSEPAKPAEKGERFDNLLEAEMVKDKKVARKEDGGKDKSEAKVKKRKEAKSDADTNGSEAIVQTESKIVDAVDKLKKGLSASTKGFDVKSSDLAEAVSELKMGGKKDESLNILKVSVKKVGKEAARGGIKTASESGAASLAGKLSSKHSGKMDISKLAEVGKNLEIEEKTDVKGTESELVFKPSDAAESVKQSTKPAIDMPVIELSAIVADAKSGKDESGEKFKIKTDSKLRVVDHRRATSTTVEKSLKTSVSSETSTVKGEVDAAAKVFEAFASDENSSGSRKFGGRTAEIAKTQSSVLNQLKESVNNQIVKQAGIVVKGNGTGEIKLVMKPESLGKVRIQLSLNDNHIAGRIIVENNIVREIFESNLDNLYKAFGAEGFENGGLEVSVQGQGDKSGNERRNSRGFSGRAVQAIEDAVPEVADTEWRNNAVNMVV